MLSQCPSCGKTLQFSASQQAKLQSALAALQDGKRLKFGCPHCRAAIMLDKQGQAKGDATAVAGKAPARVTPPAPPEVGWLTNGTFDDDEVVEDVPQVLVLARDADCREKVSEAFGMLGFRPVFVDGEDEAIENMRFQTYGGVVYQEGFADCTLSDSPFCRHMRGLAMSRRRSIYYVLLGESLHTLYDLEALVYSANLVVNPADLDRFSMILKKGMRDYEELFGPYIAALKEVGKK